MMDALKAGRGSGTLRGLPSPPVGPDAAPGNAAFAPASAGMERAMGSMGPVNLAAPGGGGGGGDELGALLMRLIGGR